MKLMILLSDLDSPEDDPASWGDPSYKQTRAPSSPTWKKGAILEKLEQKLPVDVRKCFSVLHPM